MVLSVVVLCVVAGGALYLINSGALQNLGQMLPAQGMPQDPAMMGGDPAMMGPDPYAQPEQMEPEPTYSAPPSQTPVTPVSRTPIAPVKAKPTLARCTSVKPGYVCRDNAGVSCYKGTAATGKIAYVCCNQIYPPCTPARLRNNFIRLYRMSRAVQPGYKGMVVGQAAMKGLCLSQSGVWNAAKNCCSKCKLGGRVVPCGGQMYKC